jgi:hypothetical protein
MYLKNLNVFSTVYYGIILNSCVQFEILMLGL